MLLAHLIEFGNHYLPFNEKVLKNFFAKYIIPLFLSCFIHLDWSPNHFIPCS
jgi:hypothetical protein